VHEVRCVLADAEARITRFAICTATHTIQLGWRSLISLSFMRHTPEGLWISPISVWLLSSHSLSPEECSLESFIGSKTESKICSS
jgi:hypothetical protein